MRESQRKWVFFLLPLFLGVPSLIHAEEKGISFHGSFSNHYRLRTTGGFTDNDLETILSLDINQPNVDRFSAAIQGGGVFDLDATPLDSPYRSAYDALNSHAVGRLYYAYFDAKDLGPFEKLRVGRQYRYEFESLQYDGITIETKPLRGVTVTAYGGVPVHLFENQIGDNEGDWMVGGAVQYDPHPNFRARLDYVHLKDEIAPFRPGFQPGTGDHEDNLFGLSLWWDINSKVSLSSRFTSFTDQVRDVSLSAAYRIPDKDFSLRFDFYRLLTAIGFKVIDLDPYAFAGSYQPYTEINLTATKGFGSHFALDGGVGVRLLDQEQIASAFNHGFERVFLAFSMFDLPIKGFSFNIAEDFYHGEDNVLGDSTFGTSAFISQQLWKNRVKVYGGTAFYLYRYNLLAGNESTNVQTYYAGVQAKFLKNLTGKFEYDFENNDFNAFHTVDMRLIWSF